MKTFSLIALVFILTCSAAFSQSKIFKQGVKLSHPLSSTGNPKFIKSGLKSTDSLKIVAILVQFQEDDNTLSTGNGKFDLSNKYYNPATQRDTVVDSPPYDSSYFADHLLFVKNYFNKSSKGKLNISYEIYGKLLTLPKKMQEYAPLKNETNLKLGELFKDSWAIADSSIDFSQYDPDKTAFVLFHAGVGRDIDLSSIYGFDPTPYDIPSVYLGLKSLQEIYGQSYQGYQTQEGFIIKNTLIIPSTELRELDVSGGKYLLQLGINGILTSSVGSFLGLPDLFNTKTGKTAIGRFGLMDGQSLFSFNGIFPPEPSAWEKVYLGWVEPITISSGDSYYNVKSSSTPEQKDSTMFKVLMNSKEYFLIENRNRNPFNTGQRVYTHNRAFRDSTLYTKDVPGFINYDIYSVDGNLTDVSYLDWSLPGDISDTANYRGGILIWHIDENVIDANILSNSINNTIEHKGIDLEEAKGSQDIGVTFNTPFGAITADGSFVDFWYNGKHYVPATIYRNEFTPTSIPNSLSYSLANNNINITGFDTINYAMKFRVKIGSKSLSPITGYPKYIGGTINNEFSQVVPLDINNNGKEVLFVNNGTNLYAFKNDGTGLSSANGLLLNGYGSMPVTSGFFGYTGDVRLISVKNNTTNSSLGIIKVNASGITDTAFTTMNNKVTAAPLLIDSSKVVLGFSNGYVYEKLLNVNQFNATDTVTKQQINKFSRDNGSSYRYITSPLLNNVYSNLTSGAAIDYLTQVSTSELRLNDTRINISYNATINNIVTADVNKDGKQEILFTSSNMLYAINSGGVLLDNFPVKLNSNILSGISVADVNDDGIFDILVTSASGDLNCISMTGKNIDGFPVKIGTNTYSTPALFNYSDTLAISVISGDGYMYSFKTDKVYKPQNILWKNYLRDKNFSNNNFRGVQSSVSYSEKLPKDRVYNWPNPVYDSKTYIRYYINGNAGTVNIRILDLSGELVTKLTGTTFSNNDNEVIWDVSKVASGLYYGVVEATIDGSTETKVIKIAVVK
ncbi:MAG: T9SS type A sorting domain-containing protein [Ignavibacteriota bacterium]|nr:T9SS type A sorting domain-containing protein [Ignavibacteriota bacterium]